MLPFIFGPYSSGRRRMVACRECRSATSRISASASSLLTPYGSTGLGVDCSVSALSLASPAALTVLAKTTRATPAASASSSRILVPSTFTRRNSLRGSCADSRITCTRAARWTTVSAPARTERRAAAYREQPGERGNHRVQAEPGNFEDLFYQTLKQPGTTTPSGDMSPAGIYVGLGVRICNTQLDTEQGSMENTGRQLDLGISGQRVLQGEDPRLDQRRLRLHAQRELLHQQGRRGRPGHGRRLQARAPAHVAARGQRTSRSARTARSRRRVAGAVEEGRDRTVARSRSSSTRRA